jgi:Rieske Fe-S protein
MNSTSRCTVVIALLGAAAVFAAEPPPAAPAAAASAAPATVPNGGTETKVIEDDKVRIEEKRLRGQTQSVTVQSKVRGVASYEVIMPPLGKDPSQDKGAAGKRTWSLFDF